MHRSVAMALLVTIAALGVADTPSTRAEDGDAQMRYGRHLAQECASCHRGDGQEGGIPVLAGRPQREIVGLLEDFRAGRKTNPVMVSVAKSLDARQTEALGTYFSSLPAPVTAVRAPAR